MYSIYNEGEFVIAERFIRIKKKKKFIATWLKLEKNFYIDKLMILMIQLINIITQNKTSLRKIKHIC